MLSRCGIRIILNACCDLFNSLDLKMPIMNTETQIDGDISNQQHEV